MNVSLVAVDSHNFPNYALMKISAWHKMAGDHVDWYYPLFSRPDRIYASKIFTFTPDFTGYAVGHPDPIKGGTGYDIKTVLPPEIEAVDPDYSIYPDFPAAYGFLTRGCIRSCPWCIVPVKEGKIRIVNSLEKVACGRKQVVLMDNNFLAAPEDFVKETLTFSSRNRIRLDFNQGLDARLVNEDNAGLLAKARWIRFIRFSCDTSAMLPHIRNAVSLLHKAKYTGQFFVYMLVKDDLAEAENRLRELVKLGVTPFAQPYRDYTANTKPTKIQQDFARYANVKGGKICLKTKFKDYYH